MPLGSDWRQRALTRSLRSRPLPQAGEVKKSSDARTTKIVLATLRCARVLSTTTTLKIDSLPATKEGSGAPKGACHPCPRIADKFARTCALVCYAAARPLSPLREGARPPFGAHACGTRHRLLPRWLSPRTGFPEDGLRESFARLALLPSVKHAPCGPVLLPVDRGPRAARERMAYPRAGTAPRFRLSGLPFRKGALTERGDGYVTEMGTVVKNVAIKRTAPRRLCEARRSAGSPPGAGRQDIQIPLQRPCCRNR